MDTRLLAAKSFQATTTYSRACSRNDTSVPTRTCEMGRPVSVSNASPWVAAVISWERNASASALTVKLSVK
jgi:hypothetical protein